MQKDILRWMIAFSILFYLSMSFFVRSYYSNYNVYLEIFSYWAFDTKELPESISFVNNKGSP